MRWQYGVTQWRRRQPVGAIRGLLCRGCNVREGKPSFAANIVFMLYRLEPPAKQLGIEHPY